MSTIDTNPSDNGRGSDAWSCALDAPPHRPP